MLIICHISQIISTSQSVTVQCYHTQMLHAWNIIGRDLPTKLGHSWGFYVGKYSSTIEHLGNSVVNIRSMLHGHHICSINLLYVLNIPYMEHLGQVSGVTCALLTRRAPQHWQTSPAAAATVFATAAATKLRTELGRGMGKWPTALLYLLYVYAHAIHDRKIIMRIYNKQINE